MLRNHTGTHDNLRVQTTLSTSRRKLCPECASLSMCHRHCQASYLAAVEEVQVHVHAGNCCSQDKWLAGIKMSFANCLMFQLIFGMVSGICGLSIHEHDMSSRARQHHLETLMSGAYHHDVQLLPAHKPVPGRHSRSLLQVIWSLMRLLGHQVAL